MHRRGLLLDRDGVINIDHGYVGKREQFTFIPGDIRVFARGTGCGLSSGDFDQPVGHRARPLHRSGLRTTDRMDARRNLHNAKAIAIDLVLACFEHSEGTHRRKYCRESFWRKPNPGMVLEAIQRLRLDPARSAFLGDTIRDMEAAQAGGIKNLFAG